MVVGIVEESGIVFIDEAYNLGSGMRQTVYQKEAVDELTYCMTEDKHKGRTIVVLAGYEREMDEMLTSVNPGFASRFVTRLEFPEWDEDDVLDYLKAAATYTKAIKAAADHGIEK